MERRGEVDFRVCRHERAAGRRDSASEPTRRRRPPRWLGPTSVRTESHQLGLSRKVNSRHLQSWNGPPVANHLARANTIINRHSPLADSLLSVSYYAMCWLPGDYLARRPEPSPPAGVIFPHRDLAKHRNGDLAEPAPHEGSAKTFRGFGSPMSKNDRIEAN